MRGGTIVPDDGRARTKVSETKGFFYPRTKSGRASIFPSPPWHYSGDLLTIEYRTDVDKVRDLLPYPLDLAEEDPGAVAVIWADWQSSSLDGEEYLDPVRSQYKECFVVIRCSFEGRTYSRCVYIWVDKDFAMARGIHQGYPKKMGSIHLTRIHPFGLAAPKLTAGARLGATLAAGDRRVISASVTLEHESSTNGFVNSHPMIHHRYMPSIDQGQPDTVAELIESGAASFEGGTPWSASAKIDIFDSPTEELADLAVREVIGGYYRQVGVVWDGGRTLLSTAAMRQRGSHFHQE